MFMKLTKAFGKPVCVLLYAVFAALAARKKPVPLLVLLSLHAFEYAGKGRKIAAEHGVGGAEALAKCLAFGFTWWLPLQKGE